MSKNGHLSNDDCANAILELAKSGTKRFLLAHLSQDNNTPEMAFDCSAKYLENNYFTEGEDVYVDIAYQYKSTAKFTVLGHYGKKQTTSNNANRQKRLFKIF